MNRLRCSYGVLLSACTATLLSIGISSNLAAQDSLPPLLSVRVVQVKPDKVAEWEGLQKELSAAITKAGQTRSVWQVTRGDLNTYHLVTPMDKYGDLDKPAPPPMEADAWARWVANVSQCVGDRQELVLQTSPDTSGLSQR